MRGQINLEGKTVLIVGAGRGIGRANRRDSRDDRQMIDQFAMV
jgi:short-subunit dehydrogenase involved in D-alanine esterification of teichoic acids